MDEISYHILSQDDMVSLQFLKLIRDSLTIQDILLLLATRFGRIENVTVLCDEFCGANPQSEVASIKAYLSICSLG